MPDLNRESLEIWNSLKPMVDEEIKSQTRGAVQRRKAKVTTAPSLSTNKIGVTEPYCAEIFIPFVSNLISATVGDYVWIEFAYGATNAYASMFASSDHKDETVAGNLHVMGNVNVGGVLDVTNRRCYATLSSEVWYRVCKFDFTTFGEAIGAAGGVLHLNITDSYGTYANDTHTIDLLFAHNKITFTNESSVGNHLGVDKIRYTYNGTSPYGGFVDIHWAGGTSYVGVSFDYTGIAANRQAKLTAMGLTAVAASPSGETILTTYTFAADTEANGTLTAASGFTIAEDDARRAGRVVYVHFYATGSIPANTGTSIGTLSGVPLPNKNIRWLAGGGVHAYDAVTPVYAILGTDGSINVRSPSAISVVNITISYIV